MLKNISLSCSSLTIALPTAPKRSFYSDEGISCLVHFAARIIIYHYSKSPRLHHDVPVAKIPMHKPSLMKMPETLS